MDPLRLLPWALRAVWALGPIVAGPVLAGDLGGREAAVRSPASAAAWTVWVAVVVATLVLHPLSLTAIRTAAPLALAVMAFAAAGEGPARAVAALAWALVVATLAFVPETATAFVNGPSYPNERRYPLRPPGPLLAGPLVLAWALTTGLPIAALLLLAHRQWLAGVATAALALAVVLVVGRALHGLSRRWVVFVPAGVVLHDPITLVDPVLFRRETVAGITPATGVAGALDLTQRAWGLALDLELREETPLVLTKPGQRVGPTVPASVVRFAPTRPGQVLDESRRRRLAG